MPFAGRLLVVGAPDRLLVVLDDEDGVAQVAQSQQGVDEPAIVALVVKLVRPDRPLLISGRAIIFLLVTLTLSAGILTNLTFKSYWGRPRPVVVTQFNGDLPFVPWWDPRGGCGRRLVLQLGGQVRDLLFEQGHAGDVDAEALGGAEVHTSVSGVAIERGSPPSWTIPQIPHMAYRRYRP